MITVVVSNLLLLIGKSDENDVELNLRLLAPFARQFVKQPTKSKETEMMNSNFTIVTHKFKINNVESAVDHDEEKTMAAA